jgi:transposase
LHSFDHSARAVNAKPLAAIQRRWRRGLGEIIHCVGIEKRIERPRALSIFTIAARLA